MPEIRPAEVTSLLKAWQRGDSSALERLMPLVYDHLRMVAQGHMRRERPDHSLGTTALVHEAYLRLVDARSIDWRDRAHFFALASTMMRRILVDAARATSAIKRGGDLARVAHSDHVDFDQLAAPESDRAGRLCALDCALEALAQLDPRRARIVELRFFGGLTVEETAVVVGVSPQTVMRDWKFARAWLARELDPVD
jgi:RNA polymerase sigma factor (TIGR02999 family)